MKRNKFLVTSLLVTVLFPSISFGALSGLKGLLVDFGNLLNTTIPVLFGLSMVYFLWGLGQFILHDTGNEKTRADGKNKMIWGVVALFVFLSIYGILNTIGDLIGIPLSGSGGPENPCPLNTHLDRGVCISD